MSDLEMIVISDNTIVKIHEDAFLYHVKEAYSLRLKKDGSFVSHYQYKPFLDKLWVLPKSANAAKLRQEMLSILEHHATISPIYESNHIINSLNISEFSHSLACMIYDLNFLLKNFTGHSIPRLNFSHVENLRTTAAINAAIKKYRLEHSKKDNEDFQLFPIDESLDEIESKSLDMKYSSEIWSMLATTLSKSFVSPFKEIILDYLIWKFYHSKDDVHDSLVKKEESINWKTRPPCGRDYSKQFGEPYAVIPFASKFKGKSKNHEAKNKDNRGAAQNKRSHQGSYKTKEHENKRNHDNRENSGVNKRELIEAAVNEVKKAIESLKNKQNLKEVHLKPQNSFYRMQQHTQSAKEGYRSESKGTDMEKHVCLYQKKS